MLYEMLTGRLPFEADNAVSVAIMQMQSEATVPHLINDEIPEGLEQITLKAMQKDTTKRYQSAAEMLSDFDEFKRNPSIKFEYTYFEDDTPTRYVDAITRIRGDVADEDASGKEEKQPKGKMSLLAILGVVAAAIVLIGGLFLLLWDNLRGRDNTVEFVVDDYVGMNYNEAVTVHPNFGKYTVELKQQVNTDYPEGYVFRQEPAGGTRTKRTELVLYIAVSRYEKVPNIFPGQSADVVAEQLTKAGFMVKESQKPSSEFKEGTVIELSPASGQEVPYGSEITMYISSGAEKAQPIPMSNVVGVEVGSAIDLLVGNGFSRTKIKTEYVNNSQPKDTVIAVTPDHTEPRLPDIEITLTVSTGFQDVKITVDLPMVDEAIDLQIYIAGKYNSALSSEYQGIKPKLFQNGKVEILANATEATYTVSVAISASGANKYQDYVIYEVNGTKGTATLLEQYDFDLSQTPEEPDQPDDGNSDAGEEA